MVVSTEEKDPLELSAADMAFLTNNLPKAQMDQLRESIRLCGWSGERQALLLTRVVNAVRGGEKGAVENDVKTAIELMQSCSEILHSGIFNAEPLSTWKDDLCLFTPENIRELVQLCREGKSAALVSRVRRLRASMPNDGPEESECDDWLHAPNEIHSGRNRADEEAAVQGLLCEIKETLEKLNSPALTSTEPFYRDLLDKGRTTFGKYPARNGDLRSKSKDVFDAIGSLVDDIKEHEYKYNALSVDVIRDGYLNFRSYLTAYLDYIKNSAGERIAKLGELLEAYEASARSVTNVHIRGPKLIPTVVYLVERPSSNEESCVVIHIPRESQAAEVRGVLELASKNEWEPVLNKLPATNERALNVVFSDADDSYGRTFLKGGIKGRS